MKPFEVFSVTLDKFLTVFTEVGVTIPGSTYINNQVLVAEVCTLIVGAVYEGGEVYTPDGILKTNY